MDLIFALEEQPDASNTCSTGAEVDDGLVALHLRFLLRPTSKFQVEALHDSQQAYRQLAAAQARGALCDPAALASLLAARGHRVVLRQAKGSITSQPQDASSYFSSLSHSFLLLAPRFGAAACRPCSQQLPECGVCPPGGCGCQLIVDPNFGSQFEVPRCTPRYQALVEQLPPVFVGPACQLAHLVDWVSREMAWSFRQCGECLPPWRRRSCILSKWLPTSAVDTPVLPPSSFAVRRTQHAPATPSLAAGMPSAGCEALATPARGQGRAQLAPAASSSSSSSSSRQRAHLVRPLELDRAAPQAQPQPSLSVPVRTGRCYSVGTAASSPPDSPLAWNGGTCSPVSVLQPGGPHAPHGCADGSASSRAAAQAWRAPKRAATSLLTRQLTQARR